MGIALQQVAAADLDGVDLESIGGLIEQPLNEHIGEIFAVATVGRVGRLIGDHAADMGAIDVELVGAGCVIAAVQGHAETGCAFGTVDAHVGEDIGFHRQQSAVTAERGARARLIIARRRAGVHPFRARLEPLHRTPEQD